MYTIVWEFEVKPESTTEFRSIYSPLGDWAKLFRHALGYVGTELLQSTENPQLFLTIDRWSHLEDFSNFQQSFGEQYSALDRRCEGLMLSERKIGAFTNLEAEALPQP